jgi:Flp pilus assembly protein TadG
MRLLASYSRARQRRLGATRKIAANEEGQALIEAAVTLPILLLLLVGATDFAMAAYGSIEVTNAANAGADYGAASAIAAADQAGIENAAATDAANMVTPAGASTLTTSVSYSYICSNGAPWAGTPPVVSCPGGAAVETILTVNTTASYSPPIHLVALPFIGTLGLPTSYTLVGQAVRKVSQ